MKLTAEYLRGKFRVLFEIIQAWRNADGPTVTWQGIPYKWFSPPQEEALRRFLDESSDDGRDVADDAKGMIVAIDFLYKEYERFRADVSTSNPAALPGGSNGMWSAFDHVIKAFQIVRADKPRSVKELRDVERVNVDQIARIYGWLNEDGSPDSIKVQEEYDSPGKHYDPVTWVAPGIKSILAENAEAFSKRRPRAAAYGFSPEQIEEAAKVGDIPTLEELLELQAPAAQIARLHKIDEAEAEEMLRAYRKTETGGKEAGEKVARDEANQVQRNRETVQKSRNQPASAS